jgi:hypothetical protein
MAIDSRAPRAGSGRRAAGGGRPAAGGRRRAAGGGRTMQFVPRAFELMS